MNDVKVQAADVRSKLKLIEKDITNMKIAGSPENAELRIRKSQVIKIYFFL